MLRLVKTEILKNVSIIRIIIFVLLCSVLIAATYKTLGKKRIDGWQEKITQEKNICEEQLRLLEKQSLNGTEDYYKTNEYIQVLDYCLKENIPFNVITPAKFVYNFSKSYNYVTLLMVVIFIIALIYIEKDNNTIKNIVLCGVESRCVLLAKIIASIILCIVYILITYVMAYIIGVCIYGVTINDYSVWIENGSIMRSNNIKEIIQICMIDVLYAIFITMFSWLCYTIKFNKSVVMICSSIMVMLGGTIEKLLDKLGISEITPLKYCYNNEDKEILKLFLIVIIYSLIFGYVSYRREVKNNKYALEVQ